MSAPVDTDKPDKQLGFEIRPNHENWTFLPEYYPKEFTEMKKKDMDRHGNGCEGESVSIKEVKNREFHVSGLILREKISTLRRLADHEDPVTLYSPLLEDGGMEVYVKRVERGNQKGWDPHNTQRLFKYDLDLISSGRDEHDMGRNAIVSEIIN
jgi:hypothetical protein